jgi:tetratricopeptide (TPR) repeat protein
VGAPGTLVARLRSSDSRVLWTLLASLARVAAVVTGRPAWTALRAEAAEHLGDAAVAAERYAEAAAHGRARVEWAHRAAALFRAEGDDEGAARAHRRATELAPGRALEHHDLARALERAGRAAEAVDAYEAALGLDATYPVWHLRLARALVKQKRWGRAVATLERAVDAGVDEVEVLDLLARARTGAGDHAGAVAALSAAIERDPTADRYHDLGAAQERCRRPGVTRDAMLGLVEGAQPDWVAVERSFATAAELAPTVGRHHHRTGLARVQLADLEGAVQALARAVELEPGDAAWAYRLGVTILQQGGQRALEPAERRAAERAFLRALAADPTHLGARKRLVDARLTEADWSRAAGAAWPDRAQVRDPVAALARFLDDDPAPGRDLASVEAALAAATPRDVGEAPRPWWLALHVRLLALGRFTLAYRVKRLVAAHAVLDTPDPTDPARCLEAARALGYLDRPNEGVDLLRSVAATTSSARWREVLAKVAADLLLLTGDASAHLARPVSTVGNDPAAECRFRELVQGRRVVIVGPGATPLEQGERIDGFDTVIRTRQLPPTAPMEHAARVGSRTDIAYYASTSTGLFGDEIRAALREGRLGLAVFRTSTYAEAQPFLERPGDLRYVPSEFKAGFLGNPMAILRIVYDVLRYRPAALEVCNIDFFLSATEYAEGHDIAQRIEERWSDLGVLAARALPHDYLADYALTRTLHRAGLLGVDPTVRELLDRSPDGYLAEMDRSRGGVEGGG